MRVALLLAVVSLAGCASLQDALAPDDALAFLAPVAVSKEAPGAEPVIAIAPDGTAYVEGIGAGSNGNQNKVFRSRDGGQSWDDVTPPAMGQERSNDGYLAVGDDGAVYASNVFSLTLQLFRSDNGGDSWMRLNVPPIPSIMHRHWYIPVGDTIHLTIEAFPPSYAPYLARAPPIPLDAADAQSGMWYLQSDDRGATWSQPVQIDPIVNFAGQSNMVSSADGQKLYVARYQEDASPPDYTYDDGHWYLLASEDAGASWERREMFDLTSEMSTAVPGLALATDGSLTLAWTQESAGNSTVHIARSADGGATWGEPVQPVGNTGTTAMAFVSASAEGRAGLMWYGAPPNGTASKVDDAWSVYYTELTGTNASAIVRVTPEPVHHGNICAKGPACGAGEDRSLLDYPWMDFDAAGSAWLVFPSTEWDRPSAFAVVARQRV